MSEADQLLKDFYIIIDPLPKTEEHFESEYAFLETFLRDDEIWDLFFKNNFNRSILETIFKSLTENERKMIFKFGIACLIQFVKCNFTGPALEKETEDYLNHEKFSNLSIAESLGPKSNEFDVNAKHTILLIMSYFIFELCIVENNINKWWSLRSLIIRQRVIKNLCPFLLRIVESGRELLMSPLTGYMKAHVAIELAQGLILFRNLELANFYINFAAKEFDIQYEFKGVLNYKQARVFARNIPQLLLKANLTKHDDELEKRETETMDVPSTIELDADVRVNTFRFTDQKQANVVLTKVEQIFFLTALVYVLGSKPQDELNIEELEPILSSLLQQKSTYSVRAATLLLRSKIEGKIKKKINRSILQYKEIVRSWESETPHYLARVIDVFIIGMPPMWTVQAEYAELLLNFGLVNEALEVYTKINMWEEIVVCYTMLNNKNKAIELLNEEYKKKNTSQLMCLLGDVTDDSSWYKTALESTKEKDAFVLWHVGNYYYNRKDYIKSIEYFDKALDINNLNVEGWFRLGFASMQIQHWNKMVEALLKYTSLETDCFEAWNNLAHGKLRSQNNECDATSISDYFHYAIICNFENWKIWENLLLYNCIKENFSDAIIVYNNLLRLKGKYLNLEVLEILVRNVSTALLQDTQDLLEKVIAEFPNEGFVWYIYAALTLDPYHQATSLHKACNNFIKSEWYKNPVSCQSVLDVSITLADIVVTDDIDRKHGIVNDTMLVLKSAVTAITKQRFEETNDSLEILSNKLKRVSDKINSTKN